MKKMNSSIDFSCFYSILLWNNISLPKMVEKNRKGLCSVFSQMKVINEYTITCEMLKGVYPH